MLRSLWSGVTGLNTHLTEMDVIGNNIANVNTTAYKSQSAEFRDIFYQTMNSGGAATENHGAVSPTQVGLGTRVSSIDTNIAVSGSAITTNNVMDLMITGDSFFCIMGEDGEMAYSRDGSFNIDANGYLVTKSDGYYVYGSDNFGTNPVVLEPIRAIRVDETGKINDHILGEPTSEAHFKGNLNKNDTELKEGRSIFMDVYGTDGEAYTLRFKITDAGDTEDNTFNVTIDKITDKNGIELKDASQPTLNFVYDKHNGKLQTISGQERSDYTFTFGGQATSIGALHVDFSMLWNTASSMNTNRSIINPYAGDFEGQNKGYPKGDLTGVSFSNDGTVYGEYSNGQSIKKGQIAVANFSNASGLEKVGDNLYKPSLNSGDAMVHDVTDDGGYISSGVLEGSNVNLAKEFTDMITTQRGFQANSKVITTSDEMLQIIRGLKT